MKRTLKKFTKSLIDQIKNKTTIKKCTRDIGQDIRAWKLQAV